MKKLKPIPTFKTEADERKFWETHDTADYLDWSKAQRVRFPNLKPSTATISIRLPVSLPSRSKSPPTNVTCLSVADQDVAGGKGRLIWLTSSASCTSPDAE
jgi:hypothetical protein